MNMVMVAVKGIDKTSQWVGSWHRFRRLRGNLLEQLIKWRCKLGAHWPLENKKTSADAWNCVHCGAGVGDADYALVPSSLRCLLGSHRWAPLPLQVWIETGNNFACRRCGKRTKRVWEAK